MNPLAYLAQVRERTGIPVVVVDWPIALDIPVIYLTRALLPRDFLATLHPNARGQRKIAGSVAPFLEPILRRRMQEVPPAAAPH